MAIEVYRCSHCGREVLVRPPGPISRSEAARRVEEELRAAARGPRGRLSPHFRLRDDIWLGVSSTRGEVPRRELPECCPACGRPDTLDESRTIE
ncbi:MAG: hypothetical protein F4Z25_05770 [Chloroflexi bacterium]|nr:hypothetical protein [Chloroflexota bacterium]MYE47175.1 hypothetical protein [Chloroflexota bacterium]